MNKRKIVIDLIMTDKCNRRCNYCPIKFGSKLLSKDKIDYILSYLQENEKEYDMCTINFFWWEPLLNFENIKYFIENNKNKNIKYTIGTNGVLLNEEILDFFIENDVKIYLTFHADKEKTYKKLLKKEFLKKWFCLIQINFIVSPENIDFVYEKIDLTVQFGFKVINIIPVMLTIKWYKEDLIELKKFVDYVDKNYLKEDNLYGVKIYKFSYFDGVPVEIGFVLDINLNLYQDSSDELFIWKHFNLLGKELIDKVEDFSFLWNIRNNNFSYFISQYDIKNITKMLYRLPEKLGYLKDYTVIYRIMNKDKNNRSNMGGNIYNVIVSKKS